MAFKAIVVFRKGDPPFQRAGYPGYHVGMVPQKPPSIGSRSAASNWPWLLPRLAFALFVAAVIALIWLYDRAEKDDQRSILISDMLWLEQALRFHMTRHEELLGQITAQHAASTEVFEAHAGALLAGKAGLVQIAWLENDGRLQRIHPGWGAAAAAGAASGIPAPEISRLARSLGRPAYSPAYAVADGDWHFEVHAPVFHGGQVAGTAVGIYSVRHLLDEAIPWWLAERYRIGVIDTAGNPLGSRSKVTAGEDHDSYQIPFDPPGHGLLLHAVPYRTPTPLASRALPAVLVVLALLVLWSLWALRRHVQGRLAAEDALRNEYAFRQAMDDSLHTGMRARDLQGRIIYVNSAFCRMVGWSASELVGRGPPMPYWPDELFDETRAMHDRILAGEGPEGGFELKFKRRDGHIIDALIHEAPLIDAQGRQTGWMGSLVDISERKHAEERGRQQEQRLQAASRLIAMGEMASSLAHELNQPLTAIAGYNAGCLNMLASGMEDRGELMAVLAKSVEQAQRAGRIIRRIYAFVRRSEPKSERCDLGEIIDEVVELIGPDARRQGVRLQLDIAGPLPPIHGDRILIAQALLNLSRNAIEAMRSTPRSQRCLSIRADIAGSAVTIALADTGCGLPDDVVRHLFEPFYTTKEEGMGMGLNICRSVIEAHQGRLWHEDNPDGGTTFLVRFPLSAS